MTSFEKKKHAEEELRAREKAEIEAQTAKLEIQIQEEKEKKAHDDLISKSIALAKEQSHKQFEATVAMANQVSHDENAKQAEDMATKLVDKDPVNAVNVIASQEY